EATQGEPRPADRRPLRLRPAPALRARSRGLEPRVVAAIGRARPLGPALSRAVRRLRRRPGRDDDRDGKLWPCPGARTLSGDGRARRRLPAPWRQRGATGGAVAADRRRRADPGL